MTAPYCYAFRVVQFDEGWRMIVTTGNEVVIHSPLVTQEQAEQIRERAYNALLQGDPDAITGIGDDVERYLADT